MNLANALTLTRLGLIPVFAYLMFMPNDNYRWVGGLVIAIAALTDWFDGWLARRLNMITQFGKIADPLVDRLLIITTLAILYIKVSELIPIWALVAVVARDALMLVGSLVLLVSGEKLKVSNAGKLATAVLMTSLVVLTLSPLIDFLEQAGVWFFYLGTLLSLASGLSYLRWGTKILKRG